MAENNSGEKFEKKLKNKMLEDISINSKQPMAEISNQIYMNKTSLKKLSKSELINLLLKQEKSLKLSLKMIQNQYQHERDQFQHRVNR